MSLASCLLIGAEFSFFSPVRVLFLLSSPFHTPFLPQRGPSVTHRGPEERGKLQGGRKRFCVIRLKHGDIGFEFSVHVQR